MNHRDLDLRILRYSDNIWLMSRKRKSLIHHTSRAIMVLEELGLQAKAPFIQHVNQGIEILGFTVTRWSIGPSKRNFEKLRQRLLPVACHSLALAQKH